MKSTKQSMKSTELGDVVTSYEKKIVYYANQGLKVTLGTKYWLMISIVNELI